MKEIKTKEFFMKRMLILMVAVCILFSFLLTGCEEDPAATGLTDAEVIQIAMASLMSGFIPLMIAMGEEGGEGPVDGSYDGSGDFAGTIILGTLEILSVGDDTLFTFAACELDFQDTGEQGDGETDITLGGAFSIGVVGGPGPPVVITITYSDLTLTGTMPDTVDEISVKIIAGTTDMVFPIYDGELDDIAQTIDVDITMSGITAAPAEIIIAIEEIVTVVDNAGTPSIDEEETEGEVISATIDGLDYTDEFNTAFAVMM